jgi:hypothetical protein
MTATHDRIGAAADHVAELHRRPAATPAGHGTSDGHGPHAAPIVRSADPRLSSAGSAAPGLMALQRSAGNAAVTSLVARPAVQRAPVEIDELSTSTGVSDVPPPAQAPGATGAGGSAVTSDGANTTITGAHISLAAPMTESDGIIRASTIIADSVVASSYTPGAGNVF